MTQPLGKRLEELAHLREDLEQYDYIIKHSVPQEVVGVKWGYQRMQDRYKDLTGEFYKLPDRDDGI